MVLRIFNKSKDDMLEATKTHRASFLTHKAEFVAFDALFSGTFGADWQTSINTSETTEDAETHTDELTIQTQAVLDQMAIARKVFGEMKYWIGKAFPNSPQTMNKLGFNDYGSVGSSQQGMVSFLAKLHSLCNSATYKPALLAANCTQPIIDNIETVRANLDGKNISQEDFKNNTPVATNARNIQYNQSWTFSLKVNAAAHVIYRDQPELLNLFLLGRSENADPFTLLGTVTNLATGVPMPEAELEIIELGIIQSPDVNGEYGFVLPDGTYTLTCKATGFVLQTFTIVIAAGVAVTQNVQLAV